MSQNLQMNIEKKPEIPKTPEVTLQLLQNVRILLDCAIKRGTYLPQELKTVGNIYENFTAGLDHLQSQVDSNTNDSAENNEATSEVATENNEATAENNEATAEVSNEATTEVANEVSNEVSNEVPAEVATENANECVVDVTSNQESTSQVDVVQEALATVNVSNEAEL